MCVCVCVCVRHRKGTIAPGLAVNRYALVSAMPSVTDACVYVPLCLRLCVCVCVCVCFLIQETFGCDMMVLHTFKGKELEGCVYRHPFADRTSPLVIGGDYITTETGAHTGKGVVLAGVVFGQQVPALTRM